MVYGNSSEFGPVTPMPWQRQQSDKYAMTPRQPHQPSPAEIDSRLIDLTRQMRGFQHQLTAAHAHISDNLEAVKELEAVVVSLRQYAGEFGKAMNEIAELRADLAALRAEHDVVKEWLKKRFGNHVSQEPAK